MPGRDSLVFYVLAAAAVLAIALLAAALVMGGVLWYGFGR